METTNVCSLCNGQVGVFATCGTCKQITQHICTKCLNEVKNPCICFSVQHKLDFLR
ncbi:hypothetical protein [Candidatus Nitrosotenuis aquarius]|uniref:hypothetical protein n=1 Tax=Candidatus Nitrosotenuis aquarius TaxID=1846278 RepID=UPI0013C318CD|nr:hypothetical protein [Candidatus Nitrosotenuis aquarius]